jgi:hypothetical protein
VTELPTFDWITEPQEVPAALKKLKPEQDVVCLICSDKRRRSPLTNECTARELIAEIEGVISRQAMGRYTIAEIAKILAQENNLDEMKLLPRLQEAANDKKLAVSDPETGGTPLAPNAQILLWNHWVSPQAVNALLASWEVTYQLEWPRPWRLPATENALSNVQSSAIPVQRATAWRLKTSIKRFPGYRQALYAFLKAEHVAGKPIPKARDVLNAWQSASPPEIQVMTDGVKYNDGKGNLKEADLKAIQQAIVRLVDK